MGSCQEPAELNRSAKSRTHLCFMKSTRCFLLCTALLASVVGSSSAQGVHWSYQSRITQSYDSAPGQKVRAPAPESVPYPIYPWEMVRAGMPGSATLQFRVTADGGVEDIRVLNSTHKEFSEPAIEAVKLWRFLPLAKNAPNYPPSVVVICSFKFELPEYGNYLAIRQPSAPLAMTTKHRIFTTSFASVYPLYVAKAERKGRKKAEVDAVICWLTGYKQRQLDGQLKKQKDFETFFQEAPKMNPARALIKGSICGVRVEDIQDPLMREIRYLDKLVDELAKRRAMEKILRT